MSIAVTRTKIIVPNRRPDLLFRPRLHELLEDLLDYPLTLISAPAGYGKTSLMIDLAHQAPYPLCWYSIDPLDHDPKRFLVHLVQSLQTQFPDVGKTTSALIESQADPLSDTAQLVSSLVNDLYESATEHFVLFWDDYHNLDSTPGFSAFTSRFVQEMDDNVHLVIASRKLIQFPDLPLLIGRRMVKGVGCDDLAFRPDEIRSYFNLIPGVSLTEAESLALEEKTEGWITGLLLTHGSRSHGKMDPEKIEQVTGLDLFAFLAEEVFEGLAPGVQRFLLRSSVFAEFDLDLCREMLGEEGGSDWQEIIDELKEQNLFIQQVEDKSTWFRYHNLFHDFLRSRLHQDLPDEESDLLTRLLDHYLAAAQWEEAFQVATELNDHECCVKVIMDASSDLIKNGRLNLLSSWLDSIADSVIREHPYLLILKGISATLTGNPLNGLHLLDQAIADKKIIDNPSHLSRALLCRSTTNRLLGRYQDSIIDTVKIINNEKPLSIESSYIAEAKREGALAYYNLGNFPEAIDLFNEALKDYASISDVENKALVHQDLGLAYLEIGNFDKANANFQLAHSIWENSNSSHMAILFNNLGSLNLAEMKFKDSYDALKRANILADDTSNTRMKGYIAASIGDLALSLNMVNKAYMNYKDALRFADESQDYFLYAYLLIHCSTCNRYLARYIDANEYIEAAKVTIYQGISHNELAMWELEKGFINLKLEDLEEATRCFRKAYKFYIDNNKIIESLKATLGLMLIYHKVKDKESLIKIIPIWETLLGKAKYLHLLYSEFHHHWIEISTIFNDHTTGPHTERLIRHFRRFIDNISSYQDMTFSNPPRNNAVTRNRLEISSFGSSNISRNGNKVTSSEWIHQRTAREIFFYLLSLPEGASKESVGLMFWPDSSPAQLNCQFNNVIYRLRRALGKDVILFERTTRKYIFNRKIDYVYDVEEFNKYYVHGENETNQIVKSSSLKKSIAIYKHPFAPDIDGVWSEPLRENLTKKYINALLSLANIELENKEFNNTLNYCFNVLNIDPYNEDACKFVIRGLSKLGRQIELIHFFNEFNTRMIDTFGVSPDSDTISLYERSLNKIVP